MVIGQTSENCQHGRVVSDLTISSPAGARPGRI